MDQKNAERHLLSYARRAIDDYHMIEEGDKIAVGVSGGKDSLALLYALCRLRIFYPKKFSLLAVTLDLGFPGMDFSPVEDICRRLDVPLIIQKTDIKEIIFDIRKEKNPCSLCAKMRRGALHDIAKANGCNKLALGHHKDDVLETFLLNLFYEGRLGTFSPVTYLDRKDITVIRPMIYVQECEVKSYVPALLLTPIVNLCPADKHTSREDMKEEIRELSQKHKDFRSKLFTAIQGSGLDRWGKDTGVNS